jgi:hypothetical protein
MTPPIAPTLTPEGRRHRCEAGVHVEFTNGTKVMTGTAAAVMAGGLLVVLRGTLHNNLAHAVGGTCLTLVAFAAIALILIRRWIVDTSEERRLLAACQREAQNQRTTYIAAQASLEVEQGRLTRDRAIQIRADAARLKAEREAMVADFEEKRAALVSETMEATFRMMQGGKLAAPTAVESKVIQFPHQHPQHQPERGRSREHGVVGP